MGCCATTAAPQYDNDFFYANSPSGEIFDENIYINERMRVIKWFPTKLKAIVLISHGLHEHGLAYFEFAHSLTSVGFGVYACDHYGHGKSRGTRGLIEDYRILPQEFAMFADWARNLHPGLPVFVFAHSMGCLIATLAIPKMPQVSAVVFCGTPFNTGPGAASPFGIKCLYPITQTSFGIWLTGVLQYFDPKGAAAPIIETAITLDPEKLRCIRMDPHRRHGDIMNQTAYQFLNMQRVARAEVLKFSLPFLCIHGTEDTIAFPAGSQFVYESAVTPANQKQIKLFPAQHEIFNAEVDIRQEAMEFVVNYFLSFLTEGGDAH